MYKFGKWDDSQITDQAIDKIIVTADIKLLEFNKIKLEQVLEVLGQVGLLWEKKGKYYNRALKELKNELSFSEEMIIQTLDLVSGLLDYAILKERVISELGSINVFDSINEKKEHQYLTSPLGKILHISAGNVFLGCIDSLLMGFLSKNISILKLSSKNHIFPKIFIESILEADNNCILSDKFSILAWKGGSKNIENKIKTKVDAIIAWGGEEMLSVYREDLPYGVKLLDFGPKVSIGVLNNDYIQKYGLAEVAKQVALDVVVWDQAACANLQNLFIDESINLPLLMDALSLAFENYPIPRGSISPDEQVDLLKEKSRADYSAMTTNILPKEGKEFFIHYDEDIILRTSPLNRTLIIKKYDSITSLCKMLSKFKPYLQTCSLGVLTNQLSIIKNLSLSGIKRFTRPGEMLKGINGAPHDGAYTLVQLVNTVSVELNQLEIFLEDITESTPYYKNYIGKTIQEFPILSANDLFEFPITESNQFINKEFLNGLYFSSGGTSGKPKFSFYENDEFRKTSELLGKSYLSLGLKTGDTVANLFVAGNMWSSFLAIEKALDFCKVKQLPIGGQSSIEDIANYLKLFKPKYLFGIPSLLIELTNYTEALNFSFEGIFYAGESFNEKQIERIKTVWNCNQFYSAGYASVDVGPIGYQTKECKKDEHFLFDGLELEIIDHEAVVTSTIRKAMPVIRYRTGDKVEIINSNYPVKFKLLGRIDSMLFIWGTRFNLAVFDSILLALGIDIDSFQIEIITNEFGVETLFIRSEKMIPIDILSKKLYEAVEDIRQTLQLHFIENNIKLLLEKPKLNSRTGKQPKFIDKRKK